MVSSRSILDRRQDTRFVWQILLIVVPVVILSVTALYSLRQDRASVDQDARRNAGVLVGDFARRLGERAGSDLAALVASACSGRAVETQVSPRDDGDVGILCGLVIDGRIRVPIDYPLVASPPEWLNALTPSQDRAWRLVADAPVDANLSALRTAAASLAGTPRALRFNVEWAVARTEVNRDASSSATARLLDLANRAAGIASESGTPLSDLVLLLALRHLPAGGLSDNLVQDLRRRVVEQPSLLTHTLLSEAARVGAGNTALADITRRWAADGRTLDLARRLQFDAALPVALAFDAPDGAWVGFVHPLVAAERVPTVLRRSAYQFTMVSARRLEQMLRAAALNSGELPTYATATVRLGDRSWHLFSTRPTSEHPIELASATGRLALPLAVPADATSAIAGELFRIAPEALALRPQTSGGTIRLKGVPGGHDFAVAIELADANVLYASYRVRLWMAIGLVFTATLAAFGGVAGAWRAFERQRRLGELKSNFVASVSHELRAPITSVSLMVENLERGTILPGERQREYLRVIGQECRRLSSLVENLLDFSRIDRGRRQYRLEPANLEILVGRTVELMRPYAAHRNVNLVWNTEATPPELPHMTVDQEAVQQALVNLVDNAIKHSPEAADVTLGMAIASIDRDGLGGHRRYVRLVVTDRGPGIPADEQERIFEPFYRSGSELRRETPGVGLGLSIAKHVAEAHGGRVTVRSSPGEGSSFAIELPIPEAPAS